MRLRTLRAHAKLRYCRVNHERRRDNLLMLDHYGGRLLIGNDSDTANKFHYVATDKLLIALAWLENASLIHWWNTVYRESCDPVRVCSLIQIKMNSLFFRPSPCILRRRLITEREIKRQVQQIVVSANRNSLFCRDKQGSPDTCTCIGCYVY